MMQHLKTYERFIVASLILMGPPSPPVAGFWVTVTLGRADQNPY